MNVVLFHQFGLGIRRVRALGNPFSPLRDAGEQHCLIRQVEYVSITSISKVFITPQKVLGLRTFKIAVIEISGCGLAYLGSLV